MKGFRFIVEPTTDDRLISLIGGRSYIVGLDGTPWPAQTLLQQNSIVVRRQIRESGSVHLGYPVAGAGRLMLATGSLMEREEPYHLITELARGQMSRVRNQLAEWEDAGIPIGEEIQHQLQQACHSLCQAIRSEDEVKGRTHAEEALRQTLQVADRMVAAYAQHSVNARAARQGDFRPIRFSGVLPPGSITEWSSDSLLKFRAAFNHALLPPTWPLVEPVPGERDFSELDHRLEWCEQNGIACTVGPLIDFSELTLPSWLSQWEDDVQTLASFALDWVETCVARYTNRVETWDAVCRSNSADLLSLNEEQLLWLSKRSVEVIRNIDNQGRLCVTLDQPWGDYLMTDDRSYSPFSFIDTMTRVRSSLGSIGLEVAMGFSPVGSFCRHPVAFSQLLDQYKTLGLPLRIRFVYPSEPAARAASHDSGSTSGSLDDTGPDISLHRVDQPGPADPAMLGQWKDGPSETSQADWLDAFVGVALSKPFVEEVAWERWTDEGSHRGSPFWPSGGLLRSDGEPKLALSRWQGWRDRFSTRVDLSATL